MNHTALVDVMKEVKGSRYACKLSEAAKNILGYDKIEDEAVGYDNLADTWKRGGTRATLLAAYAMVDSLLLVLIVKAKKINLFYRAIANVVGLPEREIYLGDTVRRLSAVGKCFGYAENLLTPDTAHVRNEEYMWEPGYGWKGDKDFVNLRPAAGLTVSGVNGVYITPCATLDFKAQYPSIMAAYNYCMTSELSEEYAREHGLIEGKDYKTVRLENVRPVNEHACAARGKRCDGGVDGRGDPRKCKFDVRWEVVTMLVRFMDKSVYPSVLGRCSETMAALRRAYVQMKKECASRSDADVYNACQLAVKIVANSMYGGTMRVNGCVGGAITYEGRRQTKSVAELCFEKGMRVVNGDTDSVFVTLLRSPEESESFASMCRALGVCPKTTVIPEITRRLTEKAREICAEVNAGMFEKPCFLEFEKLIPTYRIYAKKCYSGVKINDDGSVGDHKAGMTGKKADTTIVKTALQYGCDRLIGRRDFAGLYAAISEMYDIVGWQIFRQNKLDHQIAELARQIPEDDLAGSEAREIRARIDDLKYRTGEIRYQNWITSREKVGNMGKPAITLATKKAIRECLIRGEGRSAVPLHIDVCRTSRVQLASGAVKILDTLTADNPPEFMAGYLDRYSGSHSAAETRLRRQALTAAKTRKEKAKNTVTKLDVTAMPNRFCVDEKARFPLSAIDREKALRVRDYIALREKALDKIRKNGYQEDVAANPSTAKEHIVIPRIRMFVENAREYDPFPPPIMLTDDMTIARREELIDGKFLPSPHSSCDLWSVYVNSWEREGVEKIRVERDGGGRVALLVSTTEEPPTLTPEMCSFDRKNVFVLKSGSSHVLNMALYKRQTASTPVIIPSWTGHELYLLNRDSYVPPSEDTVWFTIKLDLLKKAVMFFPKTRLTFEPLVGERAIRLIGGNNSAVLKVCQIHRADGRTVNNWLWAEPPLTVDTKQFAAKLGPCRAAKITFRFFRDKKAVRIYDEWEVFTETLGLVECDSPAVKRRKKMDGP